LDSYVKELISACKGGKEDGWEVVGTKKDVIICRKAVTNSSIYCVRGEGTINIPIEDVYEVILEGVQNIKNWDAMFIKGEPLLNQELENGKGRCTLVSLQFKAPTALVYNRDFCTFGSVIKLEDGSFVAFSTSVESDLYPPQTGFVRGKLMVSGHYIRPLEGGKGVAITYVVQLDPMGWIPSWVANLVSTEQPLVIAQMKDYFENRYKRKDATLEQPT